MSIYRREFKSDYGSTITVDGDVLKIQNQDDSVCDAVLCPETAKALADALYEAHGYMLPPVKSDRENRLNAAIRIAEYVFEALK